MKYTKKKSSLRIDNYRTYSRHSAATHTGMGKISIFMQYSSLHHLSGSKILRRGLKVMQQAPCVRVGIKFVAMVSRSL